MKTRKFLSKHMTGLKVGILGGALLVASSSLFAAPTAGFRLNDHLYVCQDAYCEQIDGGQETFTTDGNKVAAAWNAEDGRAYLCTKNYLCRSRITAGNGTTTWAEDHWWTLHGNPVWEGGPLQGNEPELTAAYNASKYDYTWVFLFQGTQFWQWKDNAFHGPYSVAANPYFAAAGITKVYAAYNDNFKADWNAVYMHTSNTEDTTVVVWNHQKAGGAGWVDECLPNCHLLGLGTDYNLLPEGIFHLKWSDRMILLRRTDKLTGTAEGELHCAWPGGSRIVRDDDYYFAAGDSVIEAWYYPTCSGSWGGVHSYIFPGALPTSGWDFVKK